jgi:hypothetical protein
MVVKCCKFICSGFNGIWVDEMMAADGYTEDAGYSPQTGPFNPALSCDDESTNSTNVKLDISPVYKIQVEAIFSYSIIYKQRKVGINARWGHTFVDTKILDTSSAVILGGFSFLRYSLIAAETSN